MTAPQGIRLPCKMGCGNFVYSSNPHTVCTTRVKCRTIWTLLNRRPTLKFEDIPPIPDNCPSCNAEMKPGTWSLDRLIPGKGYVPGNIQWLCMRCNRLKGNASLTELRNIVAYMERELND